MGKQISFFINQEDISLIQQFAKAKGMVTIDGLKRNCEKEIERIEQTDQLQTFYFLPNKLENQIIYVPYLNCPGEFGASISRSPLIEFFVCPRQGNKIYHPGRLYFGLKRESPYYDQVNKLFLSITRRMKKWDKTKLENYYVGPNTLQEINDDSTNIFFGRQEYTVL